MTRPIRDIHTDAVMLHGLLEGIDFLDNEGQGNARTVLIHIARGMADKLALDLDRLTVAGE